VSVCVCVDVDNSRPQNLVDEEVEYIVISRNYKTTFDLSRFIFILLVSMEKEVLYLRRINGTIFGTKEVKE